MDIEPTLTGQVFAPDYDVTSDAKTFLATALEIAKECKAPGMLPDFSQRVADTVERKRTLLRKPDIP